MKQIILAAGRGARLKPLTQNVPKPLVPVFNEKSILDISMHSGYLLNNIEQTIIITGYKSSRFQEKINSYDCNVDLIKNDNYDLAGPILSVKKGIDAVANSDFILQNGDTIYSPKVFFLMCADRGPGIYIGTSRSENYDRDAMKLILDNTGTLETLGKNLQSDVDAVSTGIVSVRGEEYKKAFHETVEDIMSDSDGNPQQYWHIILGRLADRGVNINTICIDDTWWHEVDTVWDIKELWSDDLFAEIFDNY